MAVFTVHIPAAPAGAAPSADKIVLLRDGFSFPAALFGPLWLIWNRAFLAALGWIMLLALVGLVSAKLGLKGGATLLVSLGLAIGLGFEGVRLVAWTLSRRGFRESGVVVGDSAEEAEEVFFHNWRGDLPPPPPPPPSPTSRPIEEPGV